VTESVIVSKKSGALADELRRPLILLQKFSARTVSCADRDLAVDGSVLKDHSYLLECSQHSQGVQLHKCYVRHFNNYRSKPVKHKKSESRYKGCKCPATVTVRVSSISMFL